MSYCPDPSRHPNLAPALQDAAQRSSLFGLPPVDTRSPIDRLTDEVAGLREEIRALRADQGLSTVIATGRDVMAEFQTLSRNTRP